MFKAKNRNTRMTSVTLSWCLCYFWTYLTRCLSISIIDFEQVNAGRNTTNETEALKKSYISLLKIYLCVLESYIGALSRLR